MKHFNLCFLGFGNVGRALARLLILKSGELREWNGFDWRITGIASRKLGWLSRPEGFDAATMAAGESQISEGSRSDAIGQWLQRSQPDVVFETTSLNHETGQPGVDYARAGLQFGAHVITANKGVVVHGFSELDELAREVGRHFYFEATVLDGAPIFSLFRETLPAARLRGFTGIVNSTTNVIIETMEAGRSFAEGIKTAQELGITESDPTHDVDGWDATIKVCALAAVLMKRPLKPTAVRRQGIQHLNPPLVQAARAEGKPFKLVARARLAENGALITSVKPEQLSTTEGIGNVRGTSLAIHFELDILPGLTVTSHRPNLQSTAYGLLADFINAVKE